MFFKAHPDEGRIGYKKLTDADLGRSRRSHQTHIGLYEGILTFLPDQNFEDIAKFVYNEHITDVGFTFGRIENRNGTFRSPNIKAGGRGVVSVVTIIRDNVASNPTNFDWYLIWFGLESKEVVFYLFNNHSDDYKAVSKIINLDNSGSIENSNPQFNNLITYLENLVNKTSSNLIEELEVESQLGFSKKFKPFDLDKANKNFKATGKLGEELVNKYLDSLKSNGQILNFTWYNKSSETGLPYDFHIQENNQNIVRLDVKSTSYKFEQPMFFSGQEIDFITGTPNYSIFRVYNLSDTANPHLRICDNSKAFASTLIPHISDFRNNLQALNVGLPSVKLAIAPTVGNLIFKPEINL
jgi:hypothetical protein